jgi:hypothetical protein
LPKRLKSAGVGVISLHLRLGTAAAQRSARNRTTADTGGADLYYDTGGERSRLAGAMASGGIVSPTGNPDLPPEKEKEFRRDLVLRALQILKEDVHE